MSSQKTANLKLHKWVKSDPIKMAEFNENFQKIDAAIAAGAKIATGSYVGTGTYGASNPCSLTFDFPPQIVFVTSATDYNSDFFIRGSNRSTFLASTSSTAIYYNAINWGEKSVSWYTQTSGAAMVGVQLNRKGETYHYIAFG